MKKVFLLIFSIVFLGVLIQGIHAFDPLDWIKSVWYNLSGEPWRNYESRSFFVKLNKNEAGLTHGEAIFTIKNPTTFNITIDENTLGKRLDYYSSNKIKTIEYSYMEEMEISENKSDYHQVCNPYQETVLNGTNKTILTVQNCSMIESWYIENRTEKKYTPFRSIENVIHQVKVQDVCFPYSIVDSKKREHGLNCTSDFTITPQGYGIRERIENRSWEEEISRQIILQPEESIKIRLYATWEPKPINVEWIPNLKIKGVNFQHKEWEWWNSSYIHKMPLNVNQTGTSTLANIPILVNGTSGIDTASLISTGKLNSDCSDLRFVNADEDAELSFAFDNYYNNTYGCNSPHTMVWLKVDSLPITNTTVYMYYGYPGASFGNSSASEVWGNAHVWHMGEGIGTETYNATGVIKGTTNATFFGTPAWVDGKFGTGIDLIPNDYLLTNSTMSTTGNNQTIMYWFRSGGLSTACTPMSTRWGSAPEMMFYLSSTSTSFNVDTGQIAIEQTTGIANNQWRLVTVTIDGTNKNATLWIDKLSYKSDTSWTSIVDTKTMDFGADQRTQYYCNATLDEIIVYGDVKTADFIRRSYEQELSALGEEETTGDTTSPKWNDTTGYLGSNTTTPNMNSDVLLYGMGYDETALDWAILSTNESGTWRNYTDVEFRFGTQVNSNQDYNCNGNPSIINKSATEFLGFYDGGVVVDSNVMSVWYFPVNNSPSPEYSVQELSTTWHPKAEQFNFGNGDVYYVAYISGTDWDWNIVTSNSTNGTQWDYDYVENREEPDNDNADQVMICKFNDSYGQFIYENSQTLGYRELDNGAILTSTHTIKNMPSTLYYLSNRCVYNGTNYIFYAFRPGNVFKFAWNGTGWASNNVTTTFPDDMMALGLIFHHDMIWIIGAYSQAYIPNLVVYKTDITGTTSSWVANLTRGTGRMNHKPGWAMIDENNYVAIFSNETTGYSEKQVWFVESSYNYLYGSPMDMNDSVATWTWSNFTWSNSSITEGTIVGWRIYYNDTSGNENVTDIQTFLVRTNKAPQWSNNQSDTVSQYNPNQKSYFNITWTDDIEVSTVYLELNQTNYTMTNSFGGNIYNYSIILPTGTFYWKSYAIDSDVSSKQNVSDAWLFTIDKNTTRTADVLFDQSSPIVYGTELNVSCSDDGIPGNDGSWTLLRNSTNVTSSEYDVLFIHPGGIWNFTCHLSDGSNYTASSKEEAFTINKGTSLCNVSFNTSGNVYWDQDLTVNYTTLLNVSGNCTSPLTSNLYEDDISVSNPLQDKNLSIGQWKYTVNNSGNENYTSSNATFFVTINYTETYKSSVYETELITFTLTVPRLLTYENVSSDLYYNSTNVSYTSRTNTSKNVTFTKTMNVPSISETQTSVLFYWNYSYDNFALSYLTNSINQTITGATISKCGDVSDAVTLTFNLLDEVKLTSVNGTLEITINVYHENISLSKNVSFLFEDNDTYDLCLYPSYETYEIDAFIQYYAPDYPDRNYFLVDSTISNATLDINLYLLNISLVTQVDAYVQDQTGNMVENVIIKAQRYYLSTNTYKTVAMARTDFEGHGVLRLKLDDVWHKFVLEQDGVVLRTFDPLILTSSTITFQLTPEGVGEWYQYSDKISGTCYYNNDTTNFVCTYTDTSGLSQSVCLKVDKINIVNATENICNNCETSNSGTLLCNLGADPESNNYKYSLYITTPENNGVITSGFIEFAKTIGVYAINGIFATMMLTVTLSFIGLWNPKVSMFLSGLGIVVSVALGWLVVSAGSLIGFLFALGILMFKMRS